MKRLVRTVFVAATLLVILAAVASAQDDGTCSYGSVAGTWAYTLTGTLITSSGAVPFAAVGRESYDVDGNWSATQTSSMGGNIGHDVLKGTVTVNPDCTGTLKLSVYDQSGTLLRTAALDLVFLDDAREVRGIFTSLVLQPSGTSVPLVVTVSSRKLFPVYTMHIGFWSAATAAK